MKEYIDKTALLAEIEKLRKNAWESFQKGNSTEEQYYIRYGVIQDILSYLDTLEAKEVDLEEESKLIANGIMIGVQANKYNTVVYNPQRNDFNHSHLMLAARKGIELGLKAKGE